MMPLSLHPRKTQKQVQDATGFKLEIAESVGATREPSAEELRILREEVDPLGYILRRG